MTTSYKIGQTVFDLASNTLVEILDKRQTDGIYYLTSAPPDPTKDGAFPTGWRTGFELCESDDPLREQKIANFSY